MVKIQRHWKLKEKAQTEKLAQLKAATSFSETFLSLCCQRNLDTVEKIESFIHPRKETLHDPYRMNDMGKAVERMHQAIADGEKILIYGDYDADGITSTSLLVDGLKRFDAKVDYYIPNRFSDGYGPNVDRYDEFIDQGYDLIITVDNGIAGHEALNLAREKGIDVIVTDHHAIPADIPEAYALVHPAFPDSDYPCPYLAGVGVAYKLLAAFAPEIADDYLEFVAIGTIADLVPLLDENRVLTVQGLKQIRQTSRLGLQALMKVAGVNTQAIDETVIGFQIAPRLNALGRMGDANCAVELLLTDDPIRAGEIATQIEKTNRSRKDLVSQITDEAMSLAAEQDLDKEFIVVLAKGGWHAGVLGIVASRLVEQLRRPFILLSIDEATGLAKGSGRSIEGFNLYQACLSAKEWTSQFGGHEMAAGMTIPVENIPSFTEKVNEAVDFAHLPEPVLWADSEISPSDISIEMIEEINLLKPFGTDNEPPQFIIRNAYAKQVKAIGAGHAHLKFSASDQEQSVEVIAFNQGKLEKAIPDRGEIDILGQLEINEWNGYRKKQMNASDLALPKPWIVDWRTNELTADLFLHTDKLYFVYHQKLATMMSEYYPDIEILTFKDIKNLSSYSANKDVIIVDFPPSKKALYHTLRMFADQFIYLCLYKQNHWMIDGLPTREDCTQMYKFLYSYQKLPFNHLVSRAISQLKIPQNKIKWILKIFIEAKFVTVNDDMLSLNKDISKVNLKEMPSFRYLQEQIDLEEQLLYSSFLVMKKAFQAEIDC